MRCPAIVGVSLTLTCLSAGGFPEQDVSWYRGSLFSYNQMSGNVSVAFKATLYDVTSTLKFTPTHQDDGVSYLCQSSYSSEVRLNDTSQHILKLACMNLLLFAILIYDIS